jgi:hypothetical protein
MVRRWTRIGLTAAAAAALLAGPAAGAALGDEELPHYPVPYTLGAAITQPPGVSPPGSNRWNCEPSKRHPNPVILVHGLGANQSENWQTMAPLLANNGYCVFSLTYGRSDIPAPPISYIGGLQRMEDSARELSAFVDRVRSATDADKVDIVGHSEGSLMPNYYVKFLGGDRYVDHYVGLTPLWDGTTLYGVSQFEELAGTLRLGGLESALFAPLCKSCRQFLRGSDFMDKMNSDGGPAVDGVTYTMIMTKYDELVIPYTSGMMHAKNATNYVLQDRCPTDFAEHGAVAADPVAARYILNALDPEHAEPVKCHVVTPVAAVPPFER